MSETMDIAVLEIKPEQAPALYVPNGLDAYLEQIRQSVNEVADLSTKKGRDRVASLAAQVSRSKTAIEKPGREYLKRLKELPKEVEAELRRFVTECDQIRDDTRRPLTEWEEAEDARKACLQQRLSELRALADVIDASGNYLPSGNILGRLAAVKAVSLDDSWQEVATEAGVAKDAAVQKLEASLSEAKKREEEAAELERLRKQAEETQRKEYEEKLKREAAEQARLEAEVAVQREREAAERREVELKAAAENAERLRLEAEQRAEREKQEAVEAANRKAQEEAERVKRVAEQKEAIRLAEEKRVADEAAKRAADVEHRKAINNQALAGFVAAGLSEESAKLAVMAIARNAIPAVRITY